MQYAESLVTTNQIGQRVGLGRFAFLPWSCHFLLILIVSMKFDRQVKILFFQVLAMVASKAWVPACIFVNQSECMIRNFPGKLCFKGTKYR